MKTLFGSFFVAVVFGGLCYLVVENYWISFGVALSFALAFALLIFPLVQQMQIHTRKRHECYRFVNAFIIALSVTHSGEEAFTSASLGSGGEEKEIISGISRLALEERIDYLSRYFEEDFYRMFVAIFRLYEEQGGDVLRMAEPLLVETTLIEESGNEKDKIRLLCFSQFASLWAMSVLILAFLRFGLSNFYDAMVRSPLFVAVAVLYFAFALVSFVLYAFETTGEKLDLGRVLSYAWPKKKDYSKR